MDQLRESSLLFSLESLLETERERVQREAREAQRRHDEELRRVAEVAERRRLAAQEEREAQQRRAALEQERERLEQERLDALKRATVEHARVEAEGKMRLLEVEQARQHDLALAKIREGERTARYRTYSWLSTGALLAVAMAASAGYFGLVRPAHARETEQLRTLLSVTEQRASVQDRVLLAERAKNQQLSQRIKELEARPLESKPAPAAKPNATTSGIKAPTVSVDRPAPGPICVDNGDPLNGCLNRRR